LGHDHGSRSANKKALVISFILTTAFMILEAVGGWVTNSLALLSDAGHMLSDSVSLGVGVLAFVMGEKLANQSKTYGYKRFEILAALFNGITLILISLYILYEGTQRLINPPDVASIGMLLIAITGLIVNLIVAWILMRGDTKENINLRAAFLHVLGDLLGSVGAIIASLLILFLNWGWADPVASIIVAILVFISGWRVTRDAVHVLMEGVPKNVDIDDIIKTIEDIPDVNSIHDLHVWSITSGQNALSCHAVVRQNLSIEECQMLLRTIENRLASKDIGHVTVQMETAQHPHKDSLLCSDQDHEHEKY
jgi:cobalt-zinc-cadmium efflux system protein